MKNAVYQEGMLSWKKERWPVGEEPFTGSVEVPRAETQLGTASAVGKLSYPKLDH